MSQSKTYSKAAIAVSVALTFAAIGVVGPKVPEAIAAKEGARGSARVILAPAAEAPTAGLDVAERR